MTRFEPLTFTALERFLAEAVHPEEDKALVIEQWRLGKAWSASLSPLAPPIVVCGLFPWKVAPALEAWFACRPEAGGRMQSVIRGMRTLLRTEMSRLVPTFCVVQPGHAPGERMARMLGFSPTHRLLQAPEAPIDGAQFWRLNP